MMYSELSERASEPVGRRERNKQRVKERLYTSALSLFTERGYDQTSIDEIAERADVARGTFFNYFQRKEDLIGTWGQQRRLKLRFALEQQGPAKDTAAVARLERCMAILGRINEDERELTAAMLTAWVKAGRPLTEEPYVGELFAGIIGDGCRSGELTAELDPAQAGNMLRDIYLGTLYRWSQQCSALPPGSLVRELRAALGLVLHGIVHPTHR